jgi:hypothetical protein
MTASRAHWEAVEIHELAAARHYEAAWFWNERGDQARAALEVRSARLACEAAQIARDRAALEEVRPLESGA